jgi:hypothetical protein
MALDINTKSFVPEIVNADILRTLENELVAMKIAKNYSSDVSKFGEIVTFGGLADPTISEYTGSISSYEDLDSSEINLLVDQRNYYAFKVKDIEEQITNVDLKGSQIARAAYGLKNACDAYVLGATVTGQAYKTVTDATCDTTTILGDISAASRYLSESNVKPGDKFLVVSPWVQEKMELAGVKFSINEGMDGMAGGNAWAKYRDMDIYVSNNLVNATSEASATACLAGSYGAIAFAQNVMDSEVLRNQSGFDWLCRGLHVFGVQVIKPKELVKLALTYTAETAI